MTLLDRFRTQARDKHSDPAVRLAFVDEVPLADRETIAAIAREDDDPRVRRAAVAKLMVPSALAAIVRDDRDESVRAQAAAMLRDIALEAFEELGESDALSAVDSVADSRLLVQVARSAARTSVALRALARVDDLHGLGSVARHAHVETARLQAVSALMFRGERAELLAVALNADEKDAALAAMASITDRAELEQVMARGRNKHAVKRARQLLREADEQAAREAAEATAALVAAHPALVEPAADVASPPHGDPLADVLVAAQKPPDATTGAHAAQETVPGLEVSPPFEPVLDEAAIAAAAEAAARRTARLVERAGEAERAAADEDIRTARTRMAVIGREWRDAAVNLAVDPDLAARYTVADASLAAREAAAREADTQRRRAALARLQGLLDRVSAIAGSDGLAFKSAERALRDVRAALGTMPLLPTKQDADQTIQRLKALQGTLTPKVKELRDAEEWKRFANATIQEQLCARMEALKSAEDLEGVARQVQELQRQWREAADVPRAQAEALWRRFKAAHDDVWVRCEAYFSAQATERAGNLARKVALCEQVEVVADSSNWIATADLIKKLQAEWKTIGPVSRGKEKAIWDRFRSACDRFFTRRQADLAERKPTWAGNLAKKEALCARAEAVAESSDWGTALSEIKALQAEWRTIGPVKKTRSEAIWQRFRAACDRFFARHAARHDAARAERVAAREAMCTELEELTALEREPADLVQAVRALRGRWQQEVAQRGVDPDRARALDGRFTQAFAAVMARWPAAFAGTDFDPEANRKRLEALVQRVEALARGLTGPAVADEALSPTNRLAAMLKEALASNTIGGKVQEETRLRAAVDEVRQAETAWARVGPVPDEIRKPLASRFQRAMRAVTERAASASGAGGAARRATRAPVAR